MCSFRHFVLLLSETLVVGGPCPLPKGGLVLRYFVLIRTGLVWGGETMYLDENGVLP
jgi:hypothetical protein